MRIVPLYEFMNGINYYVTDIFVEHLTSFVLGVCIIRTNLFDKITSSMDVFSARNCFIRFS